MKSFQTSLRLKATLTFPTAVAMCAVRKALRPFLDRHDTRFKALLQMPDGVNVDTYFYHAAISELLGSEAQYDEFGHDRLFIARLDEVTIVNKLRNIFEAKRTILLCNSLEELDPDVKLIADFECVLVRPTPGHFLAAARMVGLEGMTPDDAEYLASLDFGRVKMAVNAHRTLRSAIGRLRRAAAADDFKIPEQAKPETKAKTLHDMAGYGEAATWGIQLAGDIASWKAGLIEWEDVDRGAVLCGKPGTGKTTYGRALAATCGIPIIEASSARWQAMGHLGDMLKAMRKAFELATKSAPCILFLDEIDAFGDRSSDTAGDNLDYKRQVINALLECLDPAGGRPGVVVVAATNLPEVIDPALLRPGRLERLIGIPLPDGPARVAILRQHLRGLAAPGDLRKFEEMSAGYAGANIEMVAREVRRRVRREGRALEEKDLLEALPPTRSLSDVELRRVAVHEAGHAIATLATSQDSLLWVVINRQVALDDSGSSLGHMEYRRNQSVFETKDSLMSRIGIHLAGIAAERVVYGHHSTSGGGAQGSDLRIATDLATGIERYFGFGDNLVLDLAGGVGGLEALRARDANLWHAVDLRLKESLEQTETLLREYRVELEQLADCLVERGRVSGAEVRELIAALRRGRAEPTASLNDTTTGTRPEKRKRGLRP
ncbi:AAA family ATPase [Pararhizobium gei]|uniref:AAA family ATPase n=1 Tax=Pararhizobium gei TaxID=1395951 RepID=UPI0023DABB35|nr:AAA family ATPase [Rhizobium gei]